MIADYKLYKGVPADPSCVQPAVKRLKKPDINWKTPGRRSLFSEANEIALEQLGIKSGLCPRNPQESAERRKE